MVYAEHIERIPAEVEIVVSRIYSPKPWGAIFGGQTAGGKYAKIKVLDLVVPPAEGEVWRARGHWVKDDYGWQLEAGFVVRVKPSGKLLLRFLQERIRGIGPDRVERLRRSLGERLRELLDRGDLADVAEIAAVLAPQQPALSYRLALAMLEVWRQHADEADLLYWLDSHGVGDGRLAGRIRRLFGPEAKTRLAENPYILACFSKRWTPIDRLGLSLLNERYAEERRKSKVAAVEPRRDPRRLAGAVDSVIRRRIADGHTAIPDALLREELAKRLGGSRGLADEAVVEGARVGAILEAPGGRWRAPGCALMEDQVLDRFLALAEAVDEPWSPEQEAAIDAMLALDGERPLHPEQAAAVRKLLGGRLRFLVGGAGCGKTHAVKALCDAWEALGDGRSVLLCALAGKAALRLQRATGRKAYTIFRLLKELDELAALKEAGGKWDKPYPPPRLDEKTLWVVDEASMCGLGDWHAISERVAAVPGARLVGVGDANQLAPISMGAVWQRSQLNEQLTVRLRVIHRQSEASGIPVVARAIEEQRRPDLPDYAGLGDGVSILEVFDPEAMNAAIERIANDLGGFDGSGADLVIVVAIKSSEKTATSVTKINELFHRTRRWREDGEVKGFFGNRFCTAEPVVHGRNDAETGLSNGSIGTVTALDHDAASVTAAFDGDEHVFGPDVLIDLELAYAMTCHRLQGSSARRVIIPLVGGDFLDPSWVYTAITRAEQQAVLVGTRAEFAAILARPFRHAGRCVHFSLNPEPLGMPLARLPKPNEATADRSF